MICDDDKMNDFYSLKQCQYCKPEFFYTKKQKCYYCKARTNGGPACNHCDYDSNGKIICVDCPYDKINLNGKCFDIEEELGIGCESYGVNESGNLYCINCKQGYNYINGHCVYMQNNCEDIPKCIDFKCINNGDSTFTGICSACEKGYYLDNDSSKCLKIYEKINCNFKNLINDNNFIKNCQQLCNDDNFVIITYKNDIDKNLKELDLNSINTYLSKNYHKELNDFINNLSTLSYSCLNNNDNEFKNLFKCKKAIYLETEKKYECINCISGYSKNSITKICEPIKKINCELEIINIDSKQVESCKRM